MLCPAGRLLSIRLSSAVRELAQSDANMRNSSLPFEIRDQSWKDTIKLVSEARKKYMAHRSICHTCKEEDPSASAASHRAGAHAAYCNRPPEEKLPK